MPQTASAAPPRPPTAPPPAGRAARPPRPGGNIYDLGYQGYDGPRLGRRAVLGALRATLRASYGIGRGGRAKIVPFGLAGLALLPAILAVGHRRARGPGGAGGALEDASPVNYATYQGV